jgi:hypothetical protein
MVSELFGNRPTVSALFGSGPTESGLLRVHLLGLANCLHVKTAPGIRTCYILYIYMYIWMRHAYPRGKAWVSPKIPRKNSNQQLCFINYYRTCFCFVSWFGIKKRLYVRETLNYEVRTQHGCGLGEAQQAFQSYIYVTAPNRFMRVGCWLGSREGTSDFDAQMSGKKI